jgi:hypothetical protein
VSWSSAALTVLRETELLRQRSRTGQLAAGPEAFRTVWPPAKRDRARAEASLPTLFQRSMEQSIKFITRYIHLPSLWYQQNIAWWFFLRNQQFTNLKIFSTSRKLR